MSSDFHIMVVDDDSVMRDSLDSLLKSAGFAVTLCDSAENAIKVLAEKSPDVVLSDVKMPKLTGIDLLEWMNTNTAVPLVLMSAHGDIKMAVAAVQDGAYNFLEKPFDPRSLLKILENAGKLSHLTKDSLRLRDRLSDLSGLDRLLIGASGQIKTLRKQITDIIDTDANTLLVGETGTGKELVARAIHDLGPRASKPFIAVNCAAIPINVFEETLFGQTGGQSGLLHMANGGTLFLDEVGSIEQEAQIKLLRVIETKQFAAVGSSQFSSSDFRIVSAADKDLEKPETNFRQDLIFRLNTTILRLPALRDRPDDIVLTFEHYLSKFAETYEVPAPAMTAEDIGILLAHNWPGNVRELRNVAERRMLAARNGTGSVALAMNANGGGVASTKLREAVAAFERQLIAKAISNQEGRMDDVADELGIGRRTLNEKIVKLGIKKENILGD